MSITLNVAALVDYETLEGEARRVTRILQTRNEQNARATLFNYTTFSNVSESAAYSHRGRHACCPFSIPFEGETNVECARMSTGDWTVSETGMRQLIA